jgi:large subunit ribosomal protein L13
MKTHIVKASQVERQWHVVDAKGKPLGRLASEVAVLLKGKHKPTFTPHMDVGDFVVVINAAMVELTGRKRWQKVYYRHSRYPGGLKSVSFESLQRAHPIRVVEHAVKGMLPHNRLGEAMFKKLKVYPGESHPHQAQLAVKAKKPAAAPVVPETAEITVISQATETSDQT